MLVAALPIVDFHPRMLFSMKKLFLWLANTGVKLPYFKISRLKLHKSRSEHEDGDQDGMIRES